MTEQQPSGKGFIFVQKHGKRIKRTCERTNPDGGLSTWTVIAKYPRHRLGGL